MHSLPRVETMTTTRGHGRLTKISYVYTKFIIALRHLYSAPQKNQTGSGIKLSLHHKIVSSLLFLIRLHSSAQLAQGRNYDYDSGSRYINEDFLYIYKVYNYGIKLSLHHKIVSSLLFLMKATFKCTACLGSKL